MVIASHLCYEIEKDCHGGFASVDVWLCIMCGHTIL